MSGKLPPIKENVKAYLLDTHKIPDLSSGGDPRELLETSSSVIRMSEFENQMQFAACDAIMLCLSGIGAGYTISAMYLEYANAAHIAVPSAPEFSRADGVDYYLGLGDHRDFLRVPLTTYPYTQATGEDYQSNRVTFFALSSGHTEGNNGKPFDATNQSTVFGIALVATPILGNVSNDIVLCRSYNMSEMEVDENRSIGIAHTIYSEITGE
jgi:hypothetical protein